MFSTQSLVKMLYRSKLRTELCGCPPEIFFQVWAALMGLSKLQIFLNWTSIQLSKFIIKFKKQSWTRWSQHLGSVKGNHPQKQKLRFWMEKLGSSCFHPNWGTWPPGLLPVSGDPGWGLPRITVSHHSEKALGSGWQYQLSPNRRGLILKEPSWGVPSLWSSSPHSTHCTEWETPGVWETMSSWLLSSAGTTSHWKSNLGPGRKHRLQVRYVSAKWLWTRPFLSSEFWVLVC